MDKSTKKKKIVWQQYIGIAFMFLIGAICGYVIAMYTDTLNTNTSIHKKIILTVSLFLGIYISIFLHILIHEAGHLVFGLLSGYKFSSFRILSFMWVKESEKIRLKRFSLAGTGGQCLMVPPDMKNGRIPIKLYNLGGSLNNIIISILVLVVYFFCNKFGFLSQLLLIFSIVGFMTAMMNGIPMKMGTINNDGYNAFTLSQNTKAIESLWVQLKVNEQISKGIRLKDMPDEWFVVPADEDMKNSIVSARGVLACNRLMDAQKFEEADKLMAHLLEIDSGIVGVHRNLLICDRIYVELIGENHSELINNMLSKEQKKFMKAMKRFPSVLRTEYALAYLLENDSIKAGKIRKEFDKVAQTYPHPHEISAERELMEIVEHKSNM